MARSSNNGWEFIKKGEVYQYREYPMIAMVEIVEDNSDDEYYRFIIQPLKSNCNFMEAFEVSGLKNSNFVYNEMIQFYKEEEYLVKYKYFFGEENNA